MSDGANLADDSILSRAECVEILRNATKSVDVQLKEFRISLATNVVGFLGEYYRLVLCYFEQQPNTPNESAEGNIAERCIQLFVKALPASLAEPQKALIFKKEVHLYETLLKDLQQCSPVKWCPSCLYTREDLFVLEDLSAGGYDASGAKVDAGLSASEMAQLMRALAAFHSASIIYEKQNGKSIGDEYEESSQEITVSLSIDWWATGLDTVLALAKTHPVYQLNERTLRFKLPEHLLTVCAMTGASTKYRNVLCHRDCWSANIFFTKKALQPAVILVDYQTCRYCPPAIDLAMALHMNLGRVERQQQAMAYLKLYYSNFTANLALFGIADAEHLTEEALLESYREFELFGHLYNAIAATIIRVPPDFITNEYKYGERLSKLVPYMRENPAFEQYMNDCIADLLALVLST